MVHFEVEKDTVVVVVVDVVVVAVVVPQNTGRWTIAKVDKYKSRLVD